MRILSIGNSFSRNSHTFLHRMACSADECLETTNLYIGGCPLSLHFRNMLSNEAAYELDFNGYRTGFKVSLKQSLLANEWDIITIQQASSKSFSPDSYKPYISKVIDYVREICPKAKIYIHQTWAYQDGSNRLSDYGFSSSDEMFALIEEAYNKAAVEIHADGIIRSGEAIQRLRKAGITDLQPDGFHLNDGIACYTSSLVWLKTLMGTDLDKVTFTETDIPITDEQINIAKNVVNEMNL